MSVSETLRNIVGGIKGSGGNHAASPSSRAAADGLLRLQRDDGHWAFELEADATIPSEYILLEHFLGRINQPLHERMANYLREVQEDHGGWPLFHRGALDVSASVKAYFALKCVGDSPDAPHMVKARQAILSHGGAAKSNVFTRIQLALFGAVPWRAVPVMPVEIFLLPSWFPFHLNKISYWSRTVIAPLLVLMAKRPLAVNPRRVDVAELFTVPPEKVGNWHSNNSRSLLNPVFRALDAILRAGEPFIPKSLRQRAIDKALDWIRPRLNGEHGLGAIYPAMANVVMMFHALGYSPDHPEAATAKRAVDLMVVDTKDRAYCQPCFSPIWDTGLAVHAVLESGLDEKAARSGCEWLARQQILDCVGDWAEQRPTVRPGGWAFQYANDYYPDVDDTAVVAMALDRLDREKYRDGVDRAAEWILGLQSEGGGWGAFDADNTCFYLNHIPFADHGALLDPPTADVTARCVSFLAQIGHRLENRAVHQAVEWLRSEQEKDGSWFGRWGTNYIYGTWSVLCALNAVGVPSSDPMVRRAVEWLLSKQRLDGGWSEDGASYWTDQPRGEGKQSTPSQTAWAVLGLMAAGETDNPAVENGIRHLRETQKADGLWDEDLYTAVGFPRVFYLRYHGYKAFFPAWALARYDNLRHSNSRQVAFGM